MTARNATVTVRRMENTLQKTSQRRRTQAERRAESERGLVQAAIAVVSEQGVSAATFEAIGRRGGYSRGLAGLRFGSKLGLIEAVIAHLHDDMEALAASHSMDGLPGLEALLTYVDFYLQRLARLGQVRAYFRLLSWVVADISAFRSAFAAEHDRIRNRFEGWILRGQAKGEIRKDLDATAVAQMIGGQLLGISMQVLIDPDTDLNPLRVTCLTTFREAFRANEHA